MSLSMQILDLDPSVDVGQVLQVLRGNSVPLATDQETPLLCLWVHPPSEKRWRWGINTFGLANNATSVPLRFFIL